VTYVRVTHLQQQEGDLNTQLAPQYAPQLHRTAAYALNHTPSSTRIAPSVCQACSTCT
jgi:hypothetical protein